MSREFLGDAITAELSALRGRLSSLQAQLAPSPLDPSGVARRFLSLRLLAVDRAKRAASALSLRLRGARGFIFPPGGERTVEADEVCAAADLLMGCAPAAAALGELLPGLRGAFYAWAVRHHCGCCFYAMYGLRLQLAPHFPLFGPFGAFISAAVGNALRAARSPDLWAEQRVQELGAALGELDGARQWVKQHFGRRAQSKFYARGADFRALLQSFELPKSGQAAAERAEAVEEVRAFVTDIMACVKRALESLPRALQDTMIVIAAIIRQYFSARLQAEQPDADPVEAEAFIQNITENCAVVLCMAAIRLWLSLPAVTGILTTDQLETRHGAVLAFNLLYSLDMVSAFCVPPYRDDLMANPLVNSCFCAMKAESSWERLSVRIDQQFAERYPVILEKTSPFCDGVHTAPLYELYSAVECIVLHEDELCNELSRMDDFLSEQMQPLELCEEANSVGEASMTTDQFIAKLRVLDLEALQPRLNELLCRGYSVVVAIDNKLTESMARKCKELLAEKGQLEGQDLEAFVERVNRIADGLSAFEGQFEREILNLADDYIEQLADAEHVFEALAKDADAIFNEAAEFDTANEAEKELQQAILACEARLLLAGEFDEETTTSSANIDQSNVSERADAGNTDMKPEMEDEDQKYQKYSLAELAGEDLWRCADSPVDVSSEGLLQRMFAELRISYRVFPRTLVELFK